jgi:hypothetical protein
MLWHFLPKAEKRKSCRPYRSCLSGRSGAMRVSDDFGATHSSLRQPLATPLSRAGPRIQLDEYIEEDGATVFLHACKLGLEGIVSKRKGSPYSSGRSALAQEQEPGLGGCKARSRGGLGR